MSKRNAAIMFVLILLLGGLGCINQQAPQTNLPSQPPSQEPQIIKNSQPYAEMGDTVWIYYALWVEGEAKETNNPEWAQQLNITPSSNEPLKIELKEDSPVIKGVILNILGLEEGEEKMFDVPPSLGYPRDPQNIIRVSRYYNITSYEKVPRQEWEKRGLSTEEGTSYRTEYGQVSVNKTTEDYVIIQHVVLPRITFLYQGVPTRLKKMWNDPNITITLERVLEVNETYLLPDPQTGKIKPYTVLEKDNETITLDGNHPYAGKQLRFLIKVVKLEKGYRGMG